ncbi:hypothetical protein [Pseudoxanthomonas composti]|uniref:Uncharacterized protein n=1 Tax=Pseudoxanthomonas composti TaxID=2137479 RepID=A0A4Q1JT09_9GAMM|nr:hypothetical protein [Pseudoxanthomonas composti]RXR00861.1 hypothetical protein EPA99_16370 [Pseudoxanthomonas composti]
MSFEDEMHMVITHLIQLRQNACDPVALSATPRRDGEIALGGSLTVIDRAARCSDIAEATFGLERGDRRDAYDGQVDAATFGAIDHAVWNTQRCVIPVIGFRSDRRDAGGPCDWLPPDGIAYLPALRYSVADTAGRHGEAKVLVQADQDGRHLPLALNAISPLQWLLLAGPDALVALDQPWHRC